MTQPTNGHRHETRATMANVVLLVQPSPRRGLDLWLDALEERHLIPVVMTDAAAALRVASRADVIVTDTLLPGVIDGWELIYRLRGDGGGNGRVPIIVWTSCAWEAERARAREVGCDAFLEKPCRADELVSAVHRVLAPRELAHGPTPLWENAQAVPGAGPLAQAGPKAGRCGELRTGRERAGACGMLQHWRIAS